MRIGSRFKNVCKPLNIDGIELDYVNSIKYLGVHIKAGRLFNLCYSNMKYKYFRCFNAIYSRTKCSFSEMISVSLFKSCCLPLIMYATEAIVPNKSNILKLDNLINVCISKIFNTFDAALVCDLRQYLELFNVADMIRVRSNKFTKKFYNKNFYFADNLCLKERSISNMKYHFVF